jgi:hypothetical protein
MPDMATHIDTAVGYILERPTTPLGKLIYSPDVAACHSVNTEPPAPVTIANGRLLAADTSLDVEGFRLVSHHSAIDDLEQLEQDPAVDDVYRREMRELLQRVTGASSVVIRTIGLKKRYAERAFDDSKSLATERPARFAHCDVTSESAEGAWLSTALTDARNAGIDIKPYTRFAAYNMWRPLSQPPQYVPLAVCDARSVASNDEVIVTVVAARANGMDICHDTTGYCHNAGHRWYYYPDMTPDEVLIFKAHDTDLRHAQRTPHCAFSDPTCPADVPPRVSVEIRGLAFFD